MGRKGENNYRPERRETMTIRHFHDVSPRRYWIESLGAARIAAAVFAGPPKSLWPASLAGLTPRMWPVDLVRPWPTSGLPAPYPHSIVGLIRPALRVPAPFVRRLAPA